MIFNSSTDKLSDVTTETHTITLDMYSSFFSDRILCEAGGTHDWSEADDDSIDLQNTDLYAKISYRFSKLWRFEDTSIALEYHYREQDDEAFEANYTEKSVILVLSSAIPYTF